MATVQINNYSNSVADDTAFRAWVAQTRQALLDAGLVREISIPGQIDPTTVVKPASVGNAGFDIFRFDDTLHTSDGKQVFIRIDYGVGATITNGRLVFQVATGVNAATGALTGQIGSAGTMGNSVGTASLYVTAGPDRVWFMWGIVSISSPYMKFGVERLRNIDGTPSSVGFFYYVMPTTSSHLSGVLAYAGVSPSADSSTTSPFWLFPYLFFIANSGITIGCYTSYENDNVFSPGLIPMGKWYYVLWCVCKGSDFVNGAIYTLNVLGNNRTFLCAELGGGNTSHRYLIPWG